MSTRVLPWIVALASGLLLSGCGILQGMKQAVREELHEAPADVAPTAAEFFFELDPDWKRQHSEYQGDYGTVEYEDQNGNGKPDSPDEVVRITPRNYPSALIDFDKPYVPREDDRPARLRAR